MRSKSTYKSIVLAVAALALALTSACQRDGVDESDSGRRIRLQIEASGSSLSRSALREGEIPFELDGRSFTLGFARQQNAAASPDTRAAALNNDTHPISTIWVTALRDNGVTYFRDTEVAIRENKGTSSLFWPDEPLSFYAYTSSDDELVLTPAFTREGERCAGSFDYALPAAATASPKKDASVQPDLLFAISPDRTLEESPQVHLTFHHALSSLRFKVGTMPEGVTLKGITIAGVYGGGHCELTAASDEQVEFSWSYAGKSQNCTYTEEFDQAAQKGEQIGDSESLFMMLPQPMGSQTRLSLHFSISGTDYRFETPFNTFIEQWEADTQYLFTLNLAEEISVEVEDQVSDYVKSDITIRNTGITTGYVRAAIVGYWTDNLGQVSGMWQADDGQFDFGSEWSTYWKRGSDGFYYYLYPLEHLEETSYPLFQSYTIDPEAVTAHFSQTLEIDIAVQIIPTTEKGWWSELNDIN